MSQSAGAGVGEITVTSQFTSGMDAVAEGTSVFITGRAGTGKSTLLSLIRAQRLDRATAVVAPTGVAALNVEGETIHSFFGFRPSLDPQLHQYRAPNRLRDVELLIVDEVSMARADLVDMMDVALRRGRGSAEPFGGVQMVLVGDLYQLPPVVADHDADGLLRSYASPFFFGARALRDLRFTTIELDTVFRQRDEHFIGLLNNVRDGTATDTDLDALNSRVDPAAALEPAPGAITLTTTNRTADAVNRSMLDRLPGRVYTSRAVTSGDFDASQYRAEEALSFAVGAQVMLLVNSHEYVNGSLGHVVDVAAEGDSFRVWITLEDSGETVMIRPHRWEIVRPVRRDGQVSSEVVGSFTQLPFRLAWAVTVHKSQGKTFDQVVFDRGRRVFAAGQLYVALSRCTSLEGLTLKHPLRHQDVITDPQVKRFHARAVTKPMPADQVLKSYVGYLATGGGKYSKLTEIAVVRETAAGESVTVSTLVNPERDMADAAEAGITAADVAIAPIIEELRRPLAALVSDTVLVSQGLDEFLRMVGWDKVGTDEGLGVDLHDRGLHVATGERHSAMARASAIRDAAISLGDTLLPVRPVHQASEGDDLRGSYFLPRDRTTDEPPALETLGMAPEPTLHLLLGLSAGYRGDAATLRARVDDVARTHDINPEDAIAEASAVHERLVKAARRNGSFTLEEITVIDAFSGIFNLDIEHGLSVTDAEVFRVAPGMRVCFTGSPPTGDDYAHLAKPRLREAAAAAGLEEVKSVTKTKCDLVVAFDLSSMSGKAKKAREFGKPVLAAADFLEQLLDTANEAS